MAPEITVVIPAYNASLYLAEAIQSVKQQTFAGWELIIVNDGSTDNTEEVIKGFLSDSRIKLISQQNKGVSAARNIGIEAASGKYIAFLDADDYILPDDLQVKYDILNKNNLIDFVYSDVMNCDNKLQDKAIHTGVHPGELLREALLWQKEVIPILPSNVVVKKSILTGDLLFDENLSNCADRYMKIMLAMKATGAYIPQILVKYRDTPGSMSKKVWLLEHDEKYIIQKIIANNIVAKGMFRQRVIANIYFTLSGSWYKDAHNTSSAIKYAIKSVYTYPPFIVKLLWKAIKLGAGSK